MKMLKKLAALILAATMVLVLFTACSGDTTSTPEAQAEAQMMSTINANRQDGQKLENNSERRAIASTNIGLAASGQLPGGYSSDVWFKMDTDEIKKGKFAFTFVAKYDYQNTKLDSMIQKITGGNGSDVHLNSVTNWTDVGVVVKTVNGQTYMAVSVAVDLYPNW